MNNGTTFQETVLFPKGDLQDPLSGAELETKFRENVAKMLSPAGASKLLDAIYALPDASSVSELTTRLHALIAERSRKSPNVR